MRKSGVGQREYKQGKESERGRVQAEMGGKEDGRDEGREPHKHIV